MIQRDTSRSLQNQSASNGKLDSPPRLLLAPLGICPKFQLSVHTRGCVCACEQPKKAKSLLESDQKAGRRVFPLAGRVKPSETGWCHLSRGHLGLVALCSAHHRSAKINSSCFPLLSFLPWYSRIGNGELQFFQTSRCPTQMKFLHSPGPVKIRSV